MAGSLTSSWTPRRTTEKIGWGGSLENRCHFPSVFFDSRRGCDFNECRKTTSALLSDQAPKITPRGPWRTLSRHSSWHSAEGRPTRNARRHLRGPNATNDLITRKKSRHNPAKPGYILDALLSFSGAAGRNPRRRPRICRLERISLPVCKGSRTGRQETPRRSPRRRLDGPRSRGCLA